MWFLIGGKDIVFVFIIFILVFVIVCFCVLGLVILIVIMVGIGKGVENGILIKGGEVLEFVYKVNIVIFDKIGIIIEGKLKVIDIVLNNNVKEEYFIKIVLSVEKGLEYFFGEVIVKYGEEKNIKFEKVDNFKVILGVGI